MLKREVEKQGYLIYKVCQERVAETKSEGRVEFETMLVEA